ncbi:MAG: hypothetical protein M4D80_04840 [Myxococcota bacterium]|nr:hypothetical protein [Myxococcota bacterium]
MRLLLTVVIIALTAPLAHADTPRDAMEDYLAGEINGGWILTGMGVGGLITGGVLIAGDGDRAQGASYVTFGFGAAHLIAGVYVNVASRVRRRVYRIAINKAPQVWVEVESQRMKGVSTQLLVLKIVEVVLIAGGGTMAYLGNTKERPQLEGAGYALAAEAAATLLFDIVASRRASRYRARLSQSSMLTLDAAGQPVLLGGLTLQF